MAGSSAHAGSASGWPSALSRSTSALTLSGCERSATKTASPVAMTTTSRRPMTAASCSSRRTRMFSEIDRDRPPAQTVAASSRAGSAARQPTTRRRPTSPRRLSSTAALSGSLHHGVVDRFLRRAGEGGMVEDDKAEILFRPRNSTHGRGGDLRLDSRDLLQHDVGARKTKLPGIPQVAVLDERTRALFGSGFSTESLVAPHSGIDRRRLARVNEAVAGSRMVRRDAEGEDFAGRRGVAGLGAEPRELLFRPRSDVVGREHGHRPSDRGPQPRAAAAPTAAALSRRSGSSRMVASTPISASCSATRKR